MKLLYPISGAMALMLPIGNTKGGTCDFATTECLEKCYVKKFEASKKCTYRQNFGKYPTPDKQRDILKHLISSSPEKIAEKMLSELYSADDNRRVLHWFYSGDCPKKLTKKMGAVMRIISEEWIPQCGFTRNESLYANAPSNVRLILTRNEKQPDSLTEVQYGEKHLSGKSKPIRKEPIRYLGNAGIITRGGENPQRITIDDERHSLFKVYNIHEQFAYPNYEEKTVTIISEGPLLTTNYTCGKDITTLHVFYARTRASGCYACARFGCGCFQSYYQQYGNFSKYLMYREKEDGICDWLVK